jgi:transposase-like protein
MIERCLETELDTRLGYPKYGRMGNAAGNLRNRHSQKTAQGEQGHLDIDIPRQ